MSKKKQEEALEEMMRLDEMDELYDNLDVVYRITLKGLLSLNIEDNDLVRRTLDSIELYLRRHHAKGGHPGIVLNLDTNEFEFVTLRQSEDE